MSKVINYVLVAGVIAAFAGAAYAGVDAQGEMGPIKPISLEVLCDEATASR